MPRVANPEAMRHPKAYTDAGPGICWWCKQDVPERIFGWDGWLELCPDPKSCAQRRTKHLIEVGLRPPSWYAALEKGGAEEIRECRRVGVDVVALLESLAVDKKLAMKYDRSVGLPTDEGETYE